MGRSGVAPLGSPLLAPAPPPPPDLFGEKARDLRLRLRASPPDNGRLAPALLLPTSSSRRCPTQQIGHRKKTGGKLPFSLRIYYVRAEGKKSKNLLHRYTAHSTFLKARVPFFSRVFSPRGIHVRSLDTEMFVTTLGFSTSIAAETRTNLSRLSPAITALFSPLACHPYIFPLLEGRDSIHLYSPFSLSSP